MAAASLPTLLLHQASPVVKTTSEEIVGFEERYTEGKLVVREGLHLFLCGRVSTMTAHRPVEKHSFDREEDMFQL